MSPMGQLSQVILGAVAMGCLVAGTFFLRFWRESRDRFFLLFACSFFVEAASRFTIALTHTANEANPSLYGLRLLAYLLIVVAAVDKNRSSSLGR